MSRPIRRWRRVGGVLAPVSLQAEQKGEVEWILLSGDTAPVAGPCLRFAATCGRSEHP